MKVGDWVYHDFELCQVKRIEGNITEVTTGFIETSGKDLVCFPLNMKIKVASENIYEMYQKLHEFRALNFPAIHWYFVCIWIEICELELSQLDDGDHERRNELYKKARAFIYKVKNMSGGTVDGIEIFRRI